MLETGRPFAAFPDELDVLDLAKRVQTCGTPARCAERLCDKPGVVTVAESVPNLLDGCQVSLT